MHLILTGATGLVGSSVLDAMLKSKEITKISILSRRPVPLAEKDSRVNTIIHKDFTKYEPKVLEQLQGANGVVWALGISQLKVTKEEYVTITRDFPVAAAEALSTLPPANEPFRFIYVSAYGATTTPGTFTSLFGRVKGEAERKLSELRTSKFHVETVRPCHVDAANHDAIKPHIPSPGIVYNALDLVFGPITRTLLHSMHSPTERLGPFLTEMAMGKYDKQLDAGDPVGRILFVRISLPGGLLDNLFGILHSGLLVNDHDSKQIARNVDRCTEAVEEPVDGYDYGVHSSDLNVDRAGNHEQEDKRGRGDGGDTNRSQGRQKEVDGGTIHVNQTTKGTSKLVDDGGDTTLLGASKGDRKSGSRGSRTPSRDPSWGYLDPVGICVHSGEDEEDDGDNDQDVEDHGGQGGANENTQNEEEDTNGSCCDEEVDDFEDHALNLFGDTNDGKEFVVRQGSHDVCGNKGVKHVANDYSDWTLLGVGKRVVIWQIRSGDLGVLFGPDETLHDTRDCDGKEGGEDIVSYSPFCEHYGFFSNTVCLCELTDCLEGSQPEVTNNSEECDGSLGNLINLGSDNYADGDGKNSCADDLKCMARLLEALPPRPLDDLLLCDRTTRKVTARVGGHLNRMLLRHPLGFLGSHCNSSKLGLTLFQYERQEVC
ncbi:hypothetical protein HG531_005396 [Fusarium graminearum]|nr:hypothetical protein HG531_005396 [Fusarium graminearum]